MFQKKLYRTNPSQSKNRPRGTTSQYFPRPLRERVGVRGKITKGEQMSTYIIAEMSANHCGDKELAKKIIAKAKEVGADAVKLQTYTADTLTIDCKNPEFKLTGGTLWDNKYLYDLYKEAYTPWEWQRELKEYADSIGIELFSTPFDNSAVDFLESINVKRYKIAAFEAIDYPLIKYTASKGKPIIMSTGISSFEEIQEARCMRIEPWSVCRLPAHTVSAVSLRTVQQGTGITVLY